MTQFSVNTSKVSSSNSSNTPSGIAALYPPQTREGDVSTITGLISGTGFKHPVTKSGISQKSGQPYTINEFILFAQNEAGEKEYKHTMKDFFEVKTTDTQETWEKRVLLNIGFYLNTITTIVGETKEDGTPLFPESVDLSTMEQFLQLIKENTPASFFNEGVSFKAVNQADTAEKQYYLLSSNFPIVEVTGLGKVKFKDGQWGDKTVFTVKKPQTDGMVGGIGMSPALDLGTPSSLAGLM